MRYFIAIPGEQCQALFANQYGYTDTEQIAQVTEKGQVKKKYTYAPNGYLETVETNGTKLKYTYDSNGNIVKVENLTTGKLKSEYTYMTGNRIKQRKDYNDQTGALIRTTDYTFHPNGMLAKAITVEGTKKTVIDYGYNSDDQLISIRTTVDGNVVKNIIYEYDQDGNRLSKTVGHTHYHYHRDTNGEIFIITKQIAGGQETTASFYKDSDGNLLSFRYKDAVYYYQFNVRGDVIALTDAAGNIVATYEYDEWGNVISIIGNLEVAEANPYRYVGKYGVLYDPDSDMYVMGWRDYDPKTGRFIVPDEYEGEETEPTSLNRYLYADGDPVNNIDPDGHLPKWLQRGWKATKKLAKKGYNVAIGDDIRTLKSPKSKWYHKAGAAASIASNLIPGAGAVKWGIKAVKYGKKMKKSKKFVAVSVKKTRKSKLQSKRYSQTWGYKPSGHRKSTSRNVFTKGTPRLTKPASGDNIGVNLRSKGTGKSNLELAKPGEDLFVGTYSKSRYWNRKTNLNDTHTPHHVVQDAVSITLHGKGITINLRKDIHELTETYKSKRSLGSLRDHLAADIWELRRLLRDHGYSRERVNLQLKELIRQNKATGGFEK